MNIKKKIAIILLILGATGYAMQYLVNNRTLTPEEQALAQKQKEKDDHDRFMKVSAAGALRSFKRAMKDPSSFQYKDVIYTDKNAVCFLYNGKNGFGAYTGFSPVVMLDVTPMSKTKGYLTSASDWNKHCAGKDVKYTNITNSMKYYFED